MTDTTVAHLRYSIHVIDGSVSLQINASLGCLVRRLGFVNDAGFIF
jgi:hypothetical protein